MRCKHGWVCLLVTIVMTASGAGQDKDEKGANKAKPVAGKADVLKLIPKKFATLVDVDSGSRTVQIRFDDEQETTSWTLEPDAVIRLPCCQS